MGMMSLAPEEYFFGGQIGVHCTNADLEFFYISRLQRAWIKRGTWNFPEHPGTSNNCNNYEKNM